MGNCGLKAAAWQKAPRGRRTPHFRIFRALSRPSWSRRPWPRLRRPSLTGGHARLALVLGLLLGALLLARLTSPPSPLAPPPALPNTPPADHVFFADVEGWYRVTRNERAVASPALTGPTVRLELTQTDFTLAGKVAAAINKSLGTEGAAPLAQALDARVIEVQLPPEADKKVPFLALLENVDVTQDPPSPKVVVNARTGSVVMNQTVTLAPSAVAHGNLSVTISSTPVVSQPGAFSQGQTVVAEKADIQIKQDGGAVIKLEGGAKLTNVVKALNTLGATSGDLIAILQALKAAGSLKAELDII